MEKEFEVKPLPGPSTDFLGAGSAFRPGVKRAADTTPSTTTSKREYFVCREGLKGLRLPAGCGETSVITKSSAVHCQPLSVSTCRKGLEAFCLPHSVGATVVTNSNAFFPVRACSASCVPNE